MNRFIHLLIVDDDSIRLFISAKLLVWVGTEVLLKTKSNGQGTLNYLQKLTDSTGQLPDIILIDINMPFRDGW
ncbi:Response regulator receiver domain-containing protein [Pedobacter westerhofensis]|uniref:Response regulator receiver domain-containing protein n=1 Tax=Pedobacter westerhofensis TaxID=425512 RepID=A0A521FUQ0_9SPHI|nr:Response regulator receiver domain-containing protein [Pedobacter westerhofensis]